MTLHETLPGIQKEAMAKRISFRFSNIWNRYTTILKYSSFILFPTVVLLNLFKNRNFFLNTDWKAGKIVRKVGSQKPEVRRPWLDGSIQRIRIDYLEPIQHDSKIVVTKNKK